MQRPCAVIPSPQDLGRPRRRLLAADRSWTTGGVTYLHTNWVNRRSGAWHLSFRPEMAHLPMEAAMSGDLIYLGIDAALALGFAWVLPGRIAQS